MSRLIGELALCVYVCLEVQRVYSLPSHRLLQTPANKTVRPVT